MRWIRSWSRRKRRWKSRVCCSGVSDQNNLYSQEDTDWDTAFARIAEQLNLPEDAMPPPVPVKATAFNGKEGDDVEMGDGSATKQTSFFGVLDQQSMQWPQQPTKAEMEKILLDIRKKALLAEYGV